MPNNTPNQESLSELAEGLVELHKRYDLYRMNHSEDLVRFSFEGWLEVGMPE